MTVSFDIATLITSLVVAGIPLIIALFSGAWTLLNRMVFMPLTEISKDLKSIKCGLDLHSNRLTSVETRLDSLERSFEDT